MDSEAGTAVKTQLVYKLDNIDAEDGVDIFEIAPVLMKFGELVRSASSELGLGLEIDVRVRPFREGSWITEFVFHSDVVRTLINYLHSPEGDDLRMLLGLLGVGVIDGVVGVAEIIRFTHGKVHNFHKNEVDETITYESPDGAKITVTTAEHRLVQSPIIQQNYYSSLIVPLDKFPSATSVTLSVGGDPSDQTQTFTAADKPAFQRYANAELAEELTHSTSTLAGALIKPRRGSYSGEEKAYSFVMGDSILWPVTIEDEHFLGQLKSGRVRPYSEDVLKVDLDVKQRLDRRNKMTVEYSITKVIDYIKYEQPSQLRLDETPPE